MNKKSKIGILTKENTKYFQICHNYYIIIMCILLMITMYFKISLDKIIFKKIYSKKNTYIKNRSQNNWCKTYHRIIEIVTKKGEGEFQIV